jgi:alpha-D-ribose 1-methylphosphonate 5-triphosphate synthase subunit PhnL
MHQNALLKVEGLTKTFTIHHLDRTIPAFQELHFALHPGEFLLITGPNGAGKSTLLRCLYRTYLPTGGHAWFASHYGAVDLAQAADIDIALLRQAEIGFVTQFLKTRPRVTAQELVAEPLLATGVPFSTAQRRAQEALAFFGVKSALWNRPLSPVVNSRRSTWPVRSSVPIACFCWMSRPLPLTSMRARRWLNDWLRSNAKGWR